MGNRKTSSSLGLNFAYRFNPYFSVETGYNWNKLVSDISDARLYAQHGLPRSPGHILNIISCFRSES